MRSSSWPVYPVAPAMAMRAATAAALPSALRVALGTVSVCIGKE